MKRILLPVTAIAVFTACAFDEGLIIEDVEGRIVIPEAAATQVLPRDDGTTEVVGPDVRMIGPVYVGLFPAIGDSEFPYPHPVTGPSVGGNIGDAFPYGGTTVGDFRYGCFEDLECKIVSGRYSDYDQIVEWLGVFEEDFVDAFGQPVTSGDYIRQVCFEQQFFTSDEEVRILPPDRNEDGVVDAADLDFVDQGDGTYAATFRLWQQEFVDGFSAWAFMDSPEPETGTFRTCNNDGDETGRVVDYSTTVNRSAQFQNLLNVPAEYIDRGDWVGSMENGVHVYESFDDDVEIWIDYKVGGEQ